jgi:hypothetical protein
VAVLGLAVLALAGCGRLNRVSSLNQVKLTSGATTASSLEQHLAQQGHPGAQVTCAKKMIVNVGTATSCRLSGAGTSDTVRFTFSNSKGAIDLTSVKIS